MNLFLIKNLFFLLEQTAQEKKLTVIYIGLFLAFVVFLIVDAYGLKKWTSNKTIFKIVLVFLIIAIVAFTVAYFVMIKQ